MAEARAGVREGERVGLEFRFPGGGGRRGAGRVVGLDVPDQAQRAVGLERGVQGAEGRGRGEPVEGLCGGKGLAVGLLV